MPGCPSTTQVFGKDPAPSDCPEPMAIVGMACRWPGEASTPSKLWDLLEQKQSGYRDFEENKLNLGGFYHPNQHRPGSIFTQGGYFLKEDPKQFDHNFFGITPVETMTMDPAQRKLLEVTYEAFENAGEPWEKFSGSTTGVFVGNFNYDHQLMQVRDADHPLPYVTTGGGITILSNRINYVFNLHGPSMTLDTACSSSMYALHLAVSSIRSGDCRSAIVGGSNLILGPEAQLFSTKLGAISPTSTCHTFDASADGYARADGFGVLYIKKLSDAIDNRDPIRAVIRATSINANGKTGGISHPSPEGQETVIRRAYEAGGGLDPDLTGYFECHGTGTAVGDPLEVSAVGRVFAQGRVAEPLLIGSVKPNLGHSESSSGLAGVMKAVLAIEHGQIPATIGLVNPNPNIDFEACRVKVVQETTPWPASKPIKRASINSFGYGGANAHCIVEGIESLLPGYQPHAVRQSSKNLSRSSSETNSDHCSRSSSPSRDSAGSEASTVSMMLPELVNDNTNFLQSHPADNEGKKRSCSEREIVDGQSDSMEESHVNKRHTQFSVAKDIPDELSGSVVGSRRLLLLPFSGHDDYSLKANISAIADVADLYDPVDLAYTLGCRRSKFFQRAYTIAEANDLARSCVASKTIFGKSFVSTQKVGYVFTGQGAQWPGMGRQLFAEFESYRRSVRSLDAVLRKVPEPPRWSIESALLAPAATSRVSEPELSQPLCTAIQIAMVDLLSLWNVRPVVTVGHSSGEIAAAYAAGCHTASEAIIMAYYRGKVLATNQTKGLMLAVGLGPQDVSSYLDLVEGKVVIAAVNSPKSTTLSGDTEAVRSVKEVLDQRQIFTRILQTGSKAYHSHHMAPLGEIYERLTTIALEKAAKVVCNGNIHDPAVWVSSVDPLTSPAHRDVSPSYWRKNLESAVLFSNAVERLAKLPEAKIDFLIEIGPHGALAGPLRQIRSALELQDGTKLAPCLSSIIRGEDSVHNMLSLAGNLFVRNVAIDIGAVNSTGHIEETSRSTKVDGLTVRDLPNYQYHYGTPIYYESRLNKEWRLRKHLRHDILGAKQPGSAKSSPSWRNMLRIKDVPWLEDHKLLPTPIFPAAGYLAMAIEALSQHVHETANEASIRGFSFRNVAITSAMEVPDDDLGVETVLNLQATNLTASRASNRWHEFKISSLHMEQWIDNCNGSICVEMHSDSVETRFAIDPKARPVDASGWYDKFADVGLGYGPAFQALTDIKARPNQNRATATVALNSTEGSVKGGESSYIIHPATIDSCLQLALIACHAGQPEKVHKAFVPVFVEEMSLWIPSDVDHISSKGYGQAAGELRGLRGAYARTQLFGKSGNTLLDIKKLRCVSYESSVDTKTAVAIRNPYLRLLWKPDISSMTNAQAQAMFPPTTDANVLKPLFEKFDELAAYVLMEIHQGHSSLFKQSHSEHLQRFLWWVERCVERAHRGDLPYGQAAMRCSSSHRLEIIEKVSNQLHTIVEARLIKRVFDQLGEIFSGKTSGLDVTLKDDLLTERYISGIGISGSYPQLCRAISLIAHKWPNMKMLEIGAGTGGATRLLLNTLAGRTQSKCYDEYYFTDVSTSFFGKAQDEFSDYAGIQYKVLDIGKDPHAQGFESKYDLIIASQVLHATTTIAETIQHARSLLKPGGKMILLEITNVHIGTGLVLGTFPDYWNGLLDGRVDSPLLTKEMWQDTLVGNGFSGIDILLDDHDSSIAMASVIITTAIEPEAPRLPPSTSKPELLLIYDDIPPSLSYTLEDRAMNKGYSITLTSMRNSYALPENSRIIVLVDLLNSFLFDMDAIGLECLKTLFQRAKSVLWITAGGLIAGVRPEQALTSGLMRAVITEKPNVKIVTIDLDVGYDQADESLADLILTREAWLQDANKDSGVHESEIALRNGICHVSRLAPEDSLSQRFREQEGTMNATNFVAIDEAKPLGIDFDQSGILSSLYFREDRDFRNPLPDEHVQIRVRAIGLNVKDLAVALGRFDWDKYSTECSGVVTEVGHKVTSLVVGDAVFGAAPGNFGNFVRAPARSMQKLDPSDSFEAAASMPVIFMTAIYALDHLARLQKGESVLIQSAGGGLGMAAIQVARHLGGEIYATVGSDHKAAMLTSMFGIAQDRIFNSRDLATPSKILAETNGIGLDVILCSAAGEAMHESWRAIAPFGRFIEVGRTDVLDHGKLNMEVFKRNATFSSFDLGLMNQQMPAKVSDLMSKLKSLRAQGAIQPLHHIQTFDISRLEQAMMQFAKGVHIGKLVVTFQDPTTTLKVRATPEPVCFDPDACYLLAGCLGGVGRSISIWMAEHGAKHLVYLSRSGSPSIVANEMLNDLQAMNVVTQVIKCDITSQPAVLAAVRQVITPIKGVIQAAMVVNDAMFDNMSLTQFRSVMDPKVIGTLNLHAATLDQPLDFFTMTSSIVTMIGTATQGSYCAGNAFQDSFARHRASLGLPAQSFALGMILEVGFVSQLPDVQRSLVRNGVYGSAKVEFLKLLEGSFASQMGAKAGTAKSGGTAAPDPLAKAHLLTGLEPAKLLGLYRKGLATAFTWHTDARFGRLLQALEDLSHQEVQTSGGAGGNSSSSSAVVAALANSSLNPTELKDLLTSAILERLSKLLFTPADEMDPLKAVSTYGMDSMIAAELRNWFIKVLKTDIAFLELLDPSTKIVDLVEQVVRGLEKEK